MRQYTCSVLTIFCHKSSALLHDIELLEIPIKESEAIPMTFINEKHRLNFDEALSRLNRLDRNNYALMSALYLLTADYRLWLQTKRFVENHGISLGKRFCLLLSLFQFLISLYPHAGGLISFAVQIRRLLLS